MAAEGAARSGSRVAGMVCSLWVLVLGSSVLALEGKREGDWRIPANQPGWGMGKIQERQRRVKTS